MPKKANNPKSSLITMRVSSTDVVVFCLHLCQLLYFMLIGQFPILKKVGKSFVDFFKNADQLLQDTTGVQQFLQEVPTLIKSVMLFVFT